MTIFGITLSAAILWLIAAAICAVIEAFTLGLTTVWFAGGAVCASVAAMLGASVVLQVTIFLLVSALLLLFTRPIVKKKLKVGKEKTNIDSLAGREALVVQIISPVSPGQVKTDGLIWSAVAENPHSLIEKGTIVKILRVEGVKLIVTPADE